MKPLLCLLLSQMILFISSVYSQDLNEEKYLVQIPESWKNKPKLLIKVVDLLESNVGELKNKKETFVGKSKYRAAIFLTAPVIENITPIPNTDMVSVKFRFCSYFNIYNNKDKIIHRLIVVDSSELQSKTVNDPKYYSTQYLSDYIRPRNDEILKPLPTIDEARLLTIKQAQFKELKREQLWDIVMRRIMKTKLDGDIKEDEE